MFKEEGGGGTRAGHRADLINPVNEVNTKGQ